jgi:hypothetical protein
LDKLTSQNQLNLDKGEIEMAKKLNQGGGTGTATTDQDEVKRVSNEEFVAACVEASMNSKGIKYIADKLGLSEGYVTQRRSTLKGKGVALPELQRGGGGGGSAIDREFLNKKIAEMTNTPIKDIESSSQMLLKQAAA